MSGFDIGVAIFFGLGLLTIIYAVVRLAWRLYQDDVEPAGSDGKALFGRNKPRGSEH